MLQHAQGIGQTFEDVVVWEAKLANIYVVKQHPEAIFVAKGQGRVKGKAWVDFIGGYQGQIFTFDAKSTANKERWKSPKKFEHQYWNMKDASSHMPCFYLIEWREHQVVCAHLIRPDSPYPFVCYRIKYDYKISNQESGWFLPLVETVFRQFDGGYNGVSD